MHWIESPNSRPGEPLRSWLVEDSPVRHVDALTAVSVARAGDALRRLIDGEELPLEDEAAFGRLNWMAVDRWFEPVVAMLPDVNIDPEVAAFFREVLDQV